MLPALRQYSSWLVTNAAIITAQLGDYTLDALKHKLWYKYACVLSLLASRFSVDELDVPLDYLLDEDEDTINFEPFNHQDNHENVRRRYLCEGQVQKPRYHDGGVQRHHPDQEMLARIGDFVTDGRALAFQHV